MLKSPSIQWQRGFLIIELLLALLLLSTLGVAILTLTARHLRAVGAVHTSLRPRCERPSCDSGPAVSTCVCGAEKWIVVHD